MISVPGFKKVLQSLEGKAFQQSFYRFVNAAYLKNLLSCAGSFKNGGRYNLKNSFEVLYMAPDAQTAIEEAGLIDKFKLPPRILITVDVSLQAVFDLGEKKIIEDLGIDFERLFSKWRYPSRKESYTQKIGRLVHGSRRYEAIRYPSARVRNKPEFFNRTQVCVAKSHENSSIFENKPSNQGLRLTFKPTLSTDRRYFLPIQLPIAKHLNLNVDKRCCSFTPNTACLKRLIKL